MKQILIPIVGAAIFIALVGLLTQKIDKGQLKFNLDQLNFSQPSSIGQSSFVKINDIQIAVDLANSEALREKGLSQRSSLETKSGMLFVFEQKNITPSFWMKGMLIPIDILWIKDGQITQIDRNVKPPEKETADNKLKLYKPIKPVDYVLEVNANFAHDNAIVVGNKIDLSQIK